MVSSSASICCTLPVWFHNTKDYLVRLQLTILFLSAPLCLVRLRSVSMLRSFLNWRYYITTDYLFRSTLLQRYYIANQIKFRLSVVIHLRSALSGETMLSLEVVSFLSGSNTLQTICSPPFCSSDTTLQIQPTRLSVGIHSPPACLLCLVRITVDYMLRSSHDTTQHLIRIHSVQGLQLIIWSSFGTWLHLLREK
jgi:hypothetical protein